jgi:demethylmenaquinone methyltransferase/2-methoxy-6-polyprenyl-1,4-benzoquinol methylase
MRAPSSATSTRKCWPWAASERASKATPIASPSSAPTVGIRNFTHIDKALSEAYRVLKPGGRFLCLEFSKVDNALLSTLYDAWSFNVIPAIGHVVTNDRASYQYLVESIRRFPPQKEFAAMITAAGFAQVKWRDLSAGIAAMHSGWKF